MSLNHGFYFTLVGPSDEVHQAFRLSTNLFLFIFSFVYFSSASITWSKYCILHVTHANHSWKLLTPHRTFLYHGCLSLCLLMFSCYLQSLRDVSQSQGTFSSSNEPSSITTCSTDIIKMRRAGANPRRIKVNKTLENTSIFISLGQGTHNYAGIAPKSSPLTRAAQKRIILLL